MKILHVISSVDPRGGGPIEGVVSSSKVWFRNGHDTHIVCLDPPHAPWVLNSPVKTFAVGAEGRWHGALRRLVPWLRYGYTPRLVDWLRRNASNYDAVIVNGLWNYASFGGWRALRGSRTPYFVFTHGMLGPWFNKAYPRKAFLKSLFWRLFEHRVLRDARGVLFTCEEEKILASRSFDPYVAREFVVGYGTSDVTGDPAAQLNSFFEKTPSARGRRSILFLSRIHEVKGVDLLIDAFAGLANQYPEFDLVIAGPDQVGLVAPLRKRAENLGIGQRIHWPGMLTGDAKWGAFRAAEFFVLPSHHESFGMVIVEAMALARPVLITNKVNIWREIEADAAGIVVNDDIEGITRGLREMLETTCEERAAMGTRARQAFLSRFDMENNAMELLKLIEREIGDKDAATPKNRAAGAQMTQL